MIDKLDLKVETQIPFTRDFELLYSKVRSKAKASSYYKEVLNLRPFGISALLHLHCVFNQNHKFELVGTGQMSVEDMAGEVEKVFECQVDELTLMRADPAVDVTGVSVGWFHTHSRVRNKRGFHVIGDPTQTGTTLYFGNHPDRIAIYDKLAEIEDKRGVQELKRQLKSGRWGFDNVVQGSEGKLLVTRVERQMGASRIPAQLATFRDFRSNAASFDPFSKFLLFSAGKGDVFLREKYSVNMYLKGLGLRDCVNRDGLASTWQWINTETGGNAARLLQLLEDFVPPSPIGVSAPKLWSIYQRSLAAQHFSH